MPYGVGAMFVAIAMSLHERVLHVGGLALRCRIGGTNADRSDTVETVEAFRV